MKQPLNDQVLNIKTTGDQRGFPDSYHYHPYEATPYEAIEKLFHAYPLTSADRLVDFGCGKGRLSFAANYQFDTEVVGIEMNEVFCEEAMQNRDRYVKAFRKNQNKLVFHCALAEDYQVSSRDTVFYFFNPFSIQIFMKVHQNILKSAEVCQRNIKLILYYGSQEYFYYLEDYSPFELVDIIRLEGYNGNPFERFLIYRLAAGEDTEVTSFFQKNNFH